MRCGVARSSELCVGSHLIRAIFHHPCGPWLQNRIAELQSSKLSIEIVADAFGPSLDQALKEADVLLHVLHPVSQKILAVAPNLKLIQKIGVGLDAIDLDAAKAHNIAVCNMPGTNTQAVVELTLGLMLSVLRGIPTLDHRVRLAGDWSLPLSTQGQFGEIAGSVVGLVGHGQVARRLAIVLEALGAEVLIHGRSQITPETGQFATKSELLERSDVVSMHIPETPETRHWLDATALDQMKPGAILINTARGAVVDDAAVIQALKSGRLAGAGLDVFSNEPLAPNAPILSAPNLVALPHVAWLTRNTLERSLLAACANMIRLHNGHPLLNQHV
jgi:phosphoglycerate dehydrogenase-like enzyme